MLNRIMFIGYLGKDPEVRYTAGGDAVCNFSIASTEKWKNERGEPQERTEWLRVTAWGKLAEICGEWLIKGSLVYVGGKLQTRKYEKNGVDHYVTEAVISEMKMLGGKSKNDESASRPAPPPPATRPASPKTGTGFDNMDDDIPF